MPELPEVETTVKGLNECVKGLRIVDVWTDYGGDYHIGKQNIKDKKYFELFKQSIVKQKILGAQRRGKNVLINISGGKTILIHMKMTGHLLYGKYKKISNSPSFARNELRQGKQFLISNKNPNAKNQKIEMWMVDEEGPLKDPFNRFIRLIFTLSNGKHLAFSDMRRFGKVLLTDTKNLESFDDLKKLGPEPLLTTFTFSVFKEILLKQPKGKIKPVLMNQSLIAGIGNIYSDEILWESGVHPSSVVSNVSDQVLKKIFDAMKKILKKGIDFGGDSMSDYRNIRGERGDFQNRHNAYRRTGKECKKKNCPGKIEKIKIAGRSGHFCNNHQKLY